MKVSVKADFNKLVKAFEAAPEETRAAVRLQVKAAARDIQEYAREHHKFVTRGGATERSIMMHAEGNTATVYLGSDVAVYQHEGTPPHIIKARNKLALRFVRMVILSFVNAYIIRAYRQIHIYSMQPNTNGQGFKAGSLMPSIVF